MRCKRPIAITLTLLILTVASTVFATGYWQQQVNYLMDITLRPDLRTITGSVEVEYINNSPDTLPVLYFKAFPNAIQRGSYADLKARKDNDYSIADLKPENEGHLELTALSTSPTPIKKLIVDNTIITAILDSPILPHDTAELSFEFTTILPSPHSMRMGLFRGVTKASYWYPQVCVYDRVLGWNNSQYLGWGECYGDYGTFDVHITAPENQIVPATGVLENESEVLPLTYQAKLARTNFTGPRDSWPKFNNDTVHTKTWHYLAERTNDFTFVSSDQFCLEDGKAGNIPIVAYILRNHAAAWTSTVRLAQEVMETLSQLYHPYAWPVMRLVDCYSGMEFPMLVQIGGDGSSPGFHIVVYHEIAHNWFMGQVGSNQTDRPFLDEGFTTHAEHVVMEKYLGRKGNMDEFETWYARKFAPHEEDRDVRGFLPLYLMMYEGYDKPMVFSYDQGEEYFPYRVSAYYKTAAMHFALRSILGDSAYFAAMRQYCNEWFFKHPYEDDFAASMKAATHLELVEYFDQWFYSRSRLDYAFGGIKSTQTPQGYEHRITINNKGRFVSPIDVAVVFEQGDTTIYTIPPEGMEYAKPNCVLLPVWNQFRRFDEKYTFTIRAQRKIKQVVIDPNNLLLDINRMNNSSKFIPPIEIRLDNMKYDYTPVDKYALRLRPDLWYDEPNGAQIGVHAHGAYLAQDSISLDARIGTKSGLPSINYKFAIPLVKANAGPVLIGHAVRSDYRAYGSLAFERVFKPLFSLPDNQYVRFEMNYLDVGGDQSDRLNPITGRQTKYLPYPAWDAVSSVQFSFKTGALMTFRYGSLAVSSTNLVGSSNITDVGESWGETNNRADLNLTGNQKTRLHLSAEILSQSGEPPAQFLYDLSRVQPYRAFVESQVFRTPGTYPDEWSSWFYPTDSRVRGYQDRYIPLMRSAGGSIELTPPDLLPYSWFTKVPFIGKFLSKIDQSFFCDAASVSMKGKQSIYQPLIADNIVLDSTGSTFFMSAGLSFTAPPIWSNHHIRLDFPLYLNKPAPGDKEFAFRASVAWILPLSR